MEFNLEEFKTQGIKVNYYFICKRKLWLFDKGITMEEKNDRVLQGKNLHEVAYPRQETREVLIDDIIKVDVMEGDNIKEIKISSKMGLADRMQIAYYLYYLDYLGIKKTGTINYVREKRIEEIKLTDELKKEVEETLIDIKKVISMDKPPKFEKLPYCKKCAYYEFCYAKEVE